jgi:hypothetical protein
MATAVWVKYITRGETNDADLAAIQAISDDYYEQGYTLQQYSMGVNSIQHMEHVMCFQK